MIYQITENDIKECIKFSTKYFLDPSKPRAGRTTGTYRGLGTMIDNWLVGKLIEIGVKKIIESNGLEKILNLDFEIHQVNDDPDIISIQVDGVERDPKLFIEIKNSSEGDNYIGLTKEQYNSTITHKIVDNNPENYYIIYATIRKNNENDKDLDPYGTYLKRTSDNAIYSGFDEIENLVVEIKNIISAEHLSNFGVEFTDESFMYNPNLIDSVGTATKNQLSKLIAGQSVENFTEINIFGNKLPLIMENLSIRPPTEFGEVFIDGDIRLFQKENENSLRVYAYAKEDTILKSSFLGEYKLKRSKFYKCSVSTLGRNPALNRNNIWLSRNNIDYLPIPPVSEALQYINENI
jgi:hypothetical protein